MATIEKLVKAFEALKVFQPVGPSDEDAAKKKDPPLSKKDKMASCNIVADCICATNMRSIVDFPKFLGIAMETFLMLCDDPEADIRMMADECLNRTIKTLLETNLGRLQVELYKEMKKTGTSRCLRAAMWRFADMCHLIRPQKCRPYIVNLLPCIARICKREEEAVQEALATSLQKICPVLMSFANDSEVKALLKSFLPNLKSPSAATRRTASTSLTLICQFSRSPLSFITWLLGILLELVLPVDVEHEAYSLLGVLLGLRNLIPHLAITAGDKEQGLKGSFGATQRDQEVKISLEQIIQIYELLLYYTGHTDHNVATAALEGLQQLMRTPPPQLVPILISKNSIKRSAIHQQDTVGFTRPRSQSTVDGFPSICDDTGLEEEQMSADIQSQITTSTDSTSAFISDLESINLDAKECLENEITFTQDGADEELEDAENETVAITAENSYSGVEIGDVTEERSTLSHSSSVETLLSIKSLSPKHRPPLRKGVSQDLNGNPEYDSVPEPEYHDQLSTLLTPVPDDSIKGIGHFCDGQVPLVYCVRLLCGRFLLGGLRHDLVSDKTVRVSMKTLALGTISAAITIYPSLFIYNLFIDDFTADDKQAVSQVLLYASHPDPQLKGNTTTLIGNLIHAVLMEWQGNYDKWLSHGRATVSIGVLSVRDEVSMDDLVQILLNIIEDDSSMAARQGLIALQVCLTDILHSTQSYLGVRILLKLLTVKNNPYWLVKVELLELLGKVNFKIVSYLETVFAEREQEECHCLGKLNLQRHFLNDVILYLLGDEDARVRHSAAAALCRLIPNLFHPVDSPMQDPVIAVAKDYTDDHFIPIFHEWAQESPPLVLGLVKPFCFNPNTTIQPSVEGSLSRVITAILIQLRRSQSKYLNYGCCHALSLLAEEYLPTCYASAWGCAPPLPVLTKDGDRLMMKRSGRRRLGSLGTSSSLDEGSCICGGTLSMTLSLLTSSPMVLDLSTHQAALLLAGNLLSGTAYRSLRSTDETNNMCGFGEDGKWAALSERQLVPMVEQLLSHIARVLNACSHVIDDQVPGPPQLKASLPSLPNPPSLSPIKRKAKGEKDSTNQLTTGSLADGKGLGKAAIKERDKEGEKDRNRKDGLGTFYNLPQYMRFYEVLRGAYSNYKISLDLNVSDKFCSLLKAALEVLSQLLEIASLFDVGKYAEEFLGYLKSTFMMEPTATILCVQQLLKSLFGTNLASQWELPQGLNTSRRRLGKTIRLATNMKPGLYHCCFTDPYTQFTQSLAGAAFKSGQSDQDDISSTMAWFKKRVERKTPAILKPASRADKTAIASYIRLFEPLVIKALKQYTVTSSLPLQTEVLGLLSQLVQLRVNYCLLDSDQIFIGFVIKQFEYIEEGQIRHSETLIPHIFQFLVMLSYEKFHTKPIIGMPKIIQLCDGIMASGLQPTTHAIPALQPVVYDLFLLRGSNKMDSGKDLETQREVVVSMLLRLISYYQALEMFVIILQQCRKENEDKWKRLSRQVTDMVLPALAKQQINLDTLVALDVLHHLFESVAPSVFRPVDILLKTLMAQPHDTSHVNSLQRWLCLVLSLLRVIISQSKEEVVLSRLEELGLTVSVLTGDNSLENDKQAAREALHGLPPEETMARFLLQVVGMVAEMISQRCSCLRTHNVSHQFLCQQLAHILLYVTHMFQSGLFRRVATAAMQIVHEDSHAGLYSITDINHSFQQLGIMYPTLTLQWCNVLILLNFDDQRWWSSVMQTPKKFMMSSPSRQITDCIDQPNKKTHSCNLEIVRRGGLVLFCDYVCENLNDAEHMTWLIINHVNNLIELSHESPVQDFVSAIHRNSAASSLFIQAIHARFENLSKPSLVKKTLQALEAVHLSQSGALLTLLIDKFLNTHHLAVARICDSIACRRVETLLAEIVEESSNQLPLEDLKKLLTFMKNNGLARRHPRLTSLLNKFHQVLAPDAEQLLFSEKTHPLSLPIPTVVEIKIDKEWFISIVKDRCFSSDPNTRECALLLQKLDYADILTVIMTKEFSPSILKECITLGTLHTLEKYRLEEITTCFRGDSLTSSMVLSDISYEPLFQAAQLMLFRHINSIINMLPVPHQVLTFGTAVSVKESRYQDKVEDFFTDSTWMETVFQFAASLVQYLQSLLLFPWQPSVPLESQTDVCKFVVLVLEMVSWQIQHGSLPSSEQLQMALEGLSVVLQNTQLAIVIGQKEHVSWVCTCVRTVYQILSSCEKIAVLPNQDPQDEHPKQSFDDYHHMVAACDQISELVHCLRTHLSLNSASNYKLPFFLISPLRKIIVGLGRLPLLNSCVRIPPLVWKMGWLPSPSGEMRTKLPPLPLDYLLDKEVLKEFVYRVNSLGWISRQQFEETWMSLLGVVSSAPAMEDHELSAEEEMERSQAMVLAVKAITSLLVQSMLTPSPGNPCNSRYETIPRDKPLAFLHTRCGKKLAALRGYIERHVQCVCSFSPALASACYKLGQPATSLLQMFELNLDREIGDDEFMLGQISIESIWAVVGMLEMSLSESDSPESLDSPPIPRKQQQQSVTTVDGGRERSVAVSGLDIHSCLQFLLELYGQWLSSTAKPKPPLMLVNAVIKSIVCLSDLFTERFQFEWMLDTLLEVQKNHPPEDELVLQYLNVGACKAAAVVGVDAQGADRLLKMLDISMKSTHLPTKTSALHGALYILEAGILELTKQLIPMLAEFLTRQLLALSHSQQFVLTLWATAFYIIENYQEDIRETDIPSRLLQLAINTASSNDESTCIAVYLTIMRGLERLLLTDSLSQQDSDTIIKLSVDRLCLPSPQRALPALGLMLTCMYSGKQFEQYSPVIRDMNFGFPDNNDYAVVYQDPETLILAMERITVLFDRIKKGFPYEARIITHILPVFLADFFPPQDIMNKVIGEFISSQQPHPQLIARVVFQVFSTLHEQHQQNLVRDWVMLSLSNFTQRTPVAMAVWSLSCFFISASTNPWLKALFPHVLGRMGKMEIIDRKLFCVAALDFRHQLVEDAQKRAFHLTFQNVAVPHSPYQDLLNSCL